MPIYEQSSSKKPVAAAIFSGALSGLLMSLLFWGVIQPIMDMSELPDVARRWR